jgi:hypothetical protein
LIDEREDRQERNRDHQQRKENRGAHLFERFQAHLEKVLLLAALLPQVDLVVRIFHFHDGAVHEHADGDRNARQRHDIDRHAQQRERDECQQHRDRDRHDGDHRRRDVPEKQEDHERYDDHLNRQLVRQRVDRTVNQARAIVSRDDLDPLGRRALQLLEFGLDAVDDVDGIFTVTHHDDAADDVAPAVQVGDPAPQLGSELDSGDVPQQHGHAVRPGLDHDLLEVR